MVILARGLLLNGHTTLNETSTRAGPQRPIQDMRSELQDLPHSPVLKSYALQGKEITIY